MTVLDKMLQEQEAKAQKTTTQRKTVAATHLVPRTHTENGALSNVTTGDKNLDLFGVQGASRGRDITSVFQAAFLEDPRMALANLFYARDPRKGLGERFTGRSFLRTLLRLDANLFDRVFPFIPELGRWDDLFEFISRPTVARFIYAQLDQDHKNATMKGTQISLLAKWLPSENAGHKSTTSARIMVQCLNKYAGASLTMRTYRKMLSFIRRALDIVESKMSAGEWNKIKFENVPSRAGLLYRKAFSKQDGLRYAKYIEDLKKGKTKANTGTLYPYEFARDIKAGKYDTALDALWSALPDYLADSNTEAVVAIDGSGSMYWQESCVNGIYAGDVAASLACYFADRSKGPWKGHFFSFDSSAKLYTVPQGDLRTRMQYCIGSGGLGSTNVQAVFDAILRVGKENKIPAHQMPRVLFIVSDMQFDASSYGYSRGTNHDTMKKKFEAHGYQQPFVVYWQVNARKSDKPVKMFDENTMLVSGVSASIFKSALRCEMLNPLNAMQETLAQYDRYLDVIFS